MANVPIVRQACILWQVPIARTATRKSRRIQEGRVSNVPSTILRFLVASVDHVQPIRHQSWVVHVHRVLGVALRFRGVSVYVQLGCTKTPSVIVSPAKPASLLLLEVLAQIVLAENHLFKVVGVQHAQFLRLQSLEVPADALQEQHLT